MGRIFVAIAFLWIRSTLRVTLFGYLIDDPLIKQDFIMASYDIGAQVASSDTRETSLCQGAWANAC